MLDESGRFGFTGEVMDLVEGLWCRYRQAQGCPEGPIERLAGLLYVVAALRQDVEEIHRQLLPAVELEGAEVAELLQEELGTPPAERTAALRDEMKRRGWIGAVTPS